ncbi:MAG: hypothetical protein ACYTAF_07920 [Planctomycetota bacterium]|jgi:DNA-binding IclR family transcriptional regulator
MREENVREPLGWVLVRFQPGKIEPLRFRWGTREFRVQARNAAWTDRETRPIRHFFSVTAESGETFQLCYREGDSVWTVDSVIVP